MTRPLDGFYLAMLMAVIKHRRPGKALNGKIAHPLRRRGLVFVSDSCAHGCCHWYRATPAGYRAAGKRVPKRWR